MLFPALRSPLKSALRPPTKARKGIFSTPLDFISGQLDSRFTLSRDDANTCATKFDTTGTMALVAANLPRFDNNPTNIVAQNAIRNNTMQGAVTGTPGTIPTNWIVGALGLSTSIVAVGNVAGIPYIDVRFFGTTSGAGAFQLYMEGTTAINAGNGQTWTNSIYTAIVGGSLSNIASIKQAVDIRSAAGAYSTTQTGPDIKGLMTSQTQRFTNSQTLTDATTQYLMPILQGVVSGAVAIDITIRLGAPQLEQRASAGDLILTTGTAYQVCLPVGTLIEESRKNSIRNPRAEGATPGTPGTMPTNWAISGNGVTGLTFSVIGTGTEDGIPYADIRVNGTPSATVGGGVQCFLEFNNQAAAAQTQKWAQSAYLRLVAGSFANTNVQLNVQEYSVAPAFLGDNAATVTNPTGSSLRTQRRSTVATLSQATTAFARPVIQFATTINQAIDFTIRIGAPQLEQGALVTSEILAPVAAPAATTRALEIAIDTTLSNIAFLSTEGTLYAEFMLEGLGSSNFPGVVCFDDGTANNAINIYVSDGSDDIARFEVVTASVMQASVQAGSALTANSIVKVAASWKANSFRFAVNGAAGTEDTFGTVPTVDRMRIGNGRGGSNALNGWMRRSTYYPVQFTTAQLQSMTA